ncbi:MAG: segregation ATPase FtsK/SpoIIIE, family, partial [Actinomycetota bacterium]|nr:segregation ATPase FtsK/SpoIIIE, family [Actinomycetota bacterium]
MKLKFALRSAGHDTRDLLATIDSTTTIGDLAAHLVHTDPRRSAEVGSDGEFTLTVVDQTQRVVDARLTVPESGLRSGVTVAVTRRVESVVDIGLSVGVALIVAGPDAGKELPLWRGTAYIGRGHGAEIRLSDSSVSRRHAKLVVVAGPAGGMDVVEVVDLGSANGISVGGVEVPRAVLAAGDRVGLGDTEIEVRLTETGGGALSSQESDSASVAFSRSPRLAPLFEGREFDLPDLPERPRPSRMPWLAMMFPALMGMGLFAFIPSVYSLMFVAMSPMMMLGNYVEQRRGGKKDFESAMRDFREDVAMVAARIRESLEVEAGQRRRENPSSVECAETARRLSPLLWTRRGDTPGFLQLRLGQATLPSRSSIKLPAVGRSTAEAWSELASSMEGLSVVADVPVVADPLVTGAIGVSGARSVALPVVRSLMLQAVSLHSPAELVVAAFASTTTARDWDWLKWVPHTESAQSPISARHLASTGPACAALLSQLEDLVATGLELKESAEDPLPSRRCVLVLVENDAPAERSRLVRLAEKGWHQGICVLWLGPTTPSLPAACRVFLEVEGSQETGPEGSKGAAGYVRDGKLVTSVALDVV